MSMYPLRLNVPDHRNFRLVPEQFDGSTAGASVFPSSQPQVHGVGVISSVDEVKRNGVITGFTFMNKSKGSQTFKMNLGFDDSAKYKN
ncbi:hypothetical protein CF319_g6620 [Tilletia indica]|uniref:Uncharacterized protein n=1 Tax=Tilletia indica TaxID=43049 RepID=A0A177T620_9BASI|nr:hypothetical protein CF327_g4733 [Tilletia walkeri]KAE8219738.1 hypothetical protein CF319_g6620 [Tilletia indica]KAE8230067.1 hypothetical protein CF326_g4941 [Tilletia indica]KAE8241981.1 hypothetical protein A4X13_0g7180 [Tilletia indica]